MRQSPGCCRTGNDQASMSRLAKPLSVLIPRLMSALLEPLSYRTEGMSQSALVKPSIFFCGSRISPKAYTHRPAIMAPSNAQKASLPPQQWSFNAQANPQPARPKAHPKRKGPQPARHIPWPEVRHNPLSATARNTNTTPFRSSNTTSPSWKATSR